MKEVERPWYLSDDMIESESQALMDCDGVLACGGAYRQEGPLDGIEQVLAFPSRIIEDYFSSTPVITDKDLVQKLLFDIEKARYFVGREIAEEDPSHKQIIPYVVLICGREVFRYQRTKEGNEPRLHDKWSIGVGGHINPCDGTDDPYQTGLNRELAEEVSVKCDSRDMPEIVGLIYDGSDPVGRVHFGVVHILHLRRKNDLVFNDPALAMGHWQHVTEIKQCGDAFENWSKLVIERILG